MEQMTIFDFIKPPNLNIDSLAEKEMVDMIANATGIDFKYRDSLWGWTARRGRYDFEVKYSRYKLSDNTARFISCSYCDNKGVCASPCDTIDEAVAFFKRGLERCNDD